MTAESPVRVYCPHKVRLNSLAAAAWARKDRPSITSVSLDHENLASQMCGYRRILVTVSFDAGGVYARRAFSDESSAVRILVVASVLPTNLQPRILARGLRGEI